MRLCHHVVATLHVAQLRHVVKTHGRLAILLSLSNSLSPSLPSFLSLFSTPPRVCFFFITFHQNTRSPLVRRLNADETCGTTDRIRGAIVM